MLVCMPRRRLWTAAILAAPRYSRSSAGPFRASRPTRTRRRPARGTPPRRSPTAARRPRASGAATSWYVIGGYQFDLSTFTLNIYNDVQWAQIGCDGNVDGGWHT